jgi:hypothetical protein
MISGSGGTSSSSVPTSPSEQLYDDIFAADLASQLGSAKAEADASGSEASGYFSASAATRREIGSAHDGDWRGCRFPCARTRQSNIEILTGHRVTGLMREGGRVVGVTAGTPSGPKDFRGSVVIATSGYDWLPGSLLEVARPRGSAYSSVLDLG